jgi:hypothetical protein
MKSDFFVPAPRGMQVVENNFFIIVTFQAPTCLAAGPSLISGISMQEKRGQIGATGSFKVIF